MRNWLMTLLMACTCGNALAAWERFDAGENGDTVYLDPASMRRHGEKVKVYVLLDTKKAGTAGEFQYRSIKSELELDCANSLVRVAFVSLYTDRMASGVVVRFGSLDREPEAIEDGSPSASLRARVCAKSPLSP